MYNTGLLPVGTNTRGGGSSQQLGSSSSSEGCIPCGEDPEGGPICCSDLAAGYHKETYDAGDVKFGQVWVDPQVFAHTHYNKTQRTKQLRSLIRQ